MTIHSDDGITPSAPCVRSRRASSRSDVWSSHFAYAVSSGNVFGSVAPIVLKRATPHGLSASVSPDSMSGHSWCTTKRAVADQLSR